MSSSKSQFPEKDPYNVLGVSHTASEAEIAKAYRKLALQLHPDKQRGLSEKEQEGVAHKFQEIQTARSFLLDAEHRKTRDQYDLKRASELMRKQADEAREKGLSAKRKRMREELKRQEEAAMAGKNSQHKTNKSDRGDKNRVQELRRQGAKMREAYADKAAEKAFQQAAKKSSDAKGKLEDRQIRVKWSRKKMKTSPSEHSLAQLFARFGTVERVEMLGSKGNSALVTFQTPDSCRPCVDAYAESDEMRANFVGRRKELEQAQETTQAQAEFKASTQTKTYHNDWKLDRAAERERLLREMEQEENSTAQQTSKISKKNRTWRYPFPPPFPTTKEGDSSKPSPLEILQNTEADVFKNLLPAETIQKMHLTT